MLENPATQAPVTVIIPCYRCTDTIARTVASVANQTVKPAEVILVDDGSNDDTPAALRRLQREYGADWIKVIELDDDYGVSVARNTGWEAASYDYVAFLDSDDAWHRDKIAVQYGWMNAHPDVMLTGHSVVFKPKALNTELPPRLLTATLTSKTRLLISNHFIMSSVMVKRNCPIRFHPVLRCSQDYYFCLEVIGQGEKAVLMNYPIVYRFNAPYGERGLTKKLWTLEADELAVYRMVWQSGQISSIGYFILYLWSWIRYFRRICIYTIQQTIRRLTQASPFKPRRSQRAYDDTLGYCLASDRNSPHDSNTTQSGRWSDRAGGSHVGDLVTVDGQPNSDHAGSRDLTDR
ncbi:glycosyltransferase family 2 protein [Egbenema bharatensis]|uniref:glycosyltransferase family 2 protein n=1 Tax=Egbenema bharatensis TaxID=3463334 RepID=UPI003A88B809